MALLKKVDSTVFSLLCSPAEYEVYMAESSGFVFYGMEHYLAYMPPHKVAATNLPGKTETTTVKLEN